MANYPSITICEGFDQIPHDGRQFDTGADGLARVRIKHADRFEFIVPHTGIAAADLSTLRTFYTNNRALSFNFTSPEDGVTYVCTFASKPKETYVNGHTSVVVRLLQSG